MSRKTAINLLSYTQMKPTSRRRASKGINQVRRILVPIDFSSHAGQALGFAVPFARQLGGKIDLIHVVEWPTLPSGLDLTFAESAATITTAAKARLEKLAHRAVPRSLLGQSLVCVGRADRLVIESAEKQKSDLIVVATHGRAGLARMLHGSTAEWLVRHAPCPVLTVHPPERDAPPGKKSRGLTQRINRILVPVDFSPRSKFTVRFAANLARTMRARLGLLHVVGPLPLNSTRFRTEIRKYDAETKTLARRQLETLAGSLPENIKSDLIVHQAVPRRGVTTVAQEWRADLILLPTRGSDSLKNILLGGTAETIVRHAKCPVLTFGLDFPGWR